MSRRPVKHVNSLGMALTDPEDGRVPHISFRCEAADGRNGSEDLASLVAWSAHDG